MTPATAATAPGPAETAPGTAHGSNDTGNGSNDTRNGGNGTGTGGNGNGGNGNGGNQNGGSGGSSDRGVAWVPFGPQDPTFPTPTWPLYNAFASGDCSLLADALPANDIGDYGRLMLAICQAAVDGQPDGWETAESLAGADPGSLGNDCVAPLVEGAVGRALAWHDANPDLSPQVKLQRTGSQTACGAQSASENAGNSGDDGATDGSGATEDGSNSGDSGDTTGTSPSGAGDDASATP